MSFYSLKTDIIKSILYKKLNYIIIRAINKINYSYIKLLRIELLEYRYHQFIEK